MLNYQYLNIICLIFHIHPPISNQSMLFTLDLIHFRHISYLPLIDLRGKHSDGVLGTLEIRRKGERRENRDERGRRQRDRKGIRVEKWRWRLKIVNWYFSLLETIFVLGLRDRHLNLEGKLSNLIHLWLHTRLRPHV